MRFLFLFDLPLSDHGKKTDTRHWKRVWSGREKKHHRSFALGRRFLLFPLSFSLVFALLTCTRETQRVEGLVVGLVLVSPFIKANTSLQL